MSGSFTFAARVAVAALLGVGGIAAPAATLLVPSRYSTIQSAIDAAASNDVILVSAGTYPENLVINSKTIQLVSVSGATVTIIDGQALGSVVNLDESNVAIQGFTMIHGHADAGAGINSRLGSLTVEDSIVSDNVALSGGGMLLAATQATVHHSHIERNVALIGAGLYLNGSDAVVYDNLIELNVLEAHGAGGGVYIRGGSNTLLRNVIRRNGGSPASGGGIYGDSPGSLQIADNLVVGNDGIQGAGVFVYGGGGNRQWINNTVTDNGLAGSTQLHTEGDDSVDNVFANNIFSGRAAVHCGAAVDPPLFDYNDVHGRTSGACAKTAATGTNLTLPPGFVKRGVGHPYHLSPDSPLVDAGSNEQAQGLRRDIAKHPRIVDGGHGLIVDIGAFEYQGE